MYLSAHLRCDFVPILDVCLANHACFFNGVGERFFTVNVFAAIHGPDIDEGVGMISCRADNGINVPLFETSSPVNISFGPGELFCCRCKILRVYIAQGDDIFTLNVVQVCTTSTSNADDSDIEFFIRRVACFKDAGF